MAGRNRARLTPTGPRARPDRETPHREVTGIGGFEAVLPMSAAAVPDGCCQPESPWARPHPRPPICSPSPDATPRVRCRWRRQLTGFVRRGNGRRLLPGPARGRPPAGGTRSVPDYRRRCRAGDLVLSAGPRLRLVGRGRAGALPTEQLRCTSAGQTQRAEFWCRNAESNRGPTDYESVALPTELFRHGLDAAAR